jgi:hypothetical protein
VAPVSSAVFQIPLPTPSVRSVPRAGWLGATGDTSIPYRGVQRQNGGEVGAQAFVPGLDPFPLRGGRCASGGTVTVVP